MTSPRRRRTGDVARVAAFLLGVVVASVATGCGGDGSPVGFDAVELDSGASVSSADLHGTWVLFAAWATWCVPCERELPELEAALPELEAAGIEVVTVNVDGNGADQADVVGMIDRLAPSLAAWRDPKGEMLVAYESFLMPFSVLVDERGEVVQSWNGALDPDEIL